MRVRQYGKLTSLQGKVFVLIQKKIQSRLGKFSINSGGVLANNDHGYNDHCDGIVQFNSKEGAANH